MADPSRRFPPLAHRHHARRLRRAGRQRASDGIRLLAPGPDAAATLAAELRGDTPRDAAGGCAGKTARAYTVDIGHADGKLDDQLREALREVGS